MILPLEILLNFAIFVPFILAIYLSFTDWGLLHADISATNFIGGENYLDIFSDKRLLNALTNTGIIMAVAVPAELLLGLGIALSFNRVFPGKRVLASIILTPMMVLPTVTGLAFLILFFREGVINQLLSVVTFSNVQIDWLNVRTSALFSVILADVWQWTPFMFLVMFAGLAALPDEPLQAARVFGASRFQVFRHVTLPLLRNVLILAIVLRSIELFKIFDVPFFMTRGGPGIATETVSIHLYQTGFIFGRLSYASATALLIMVLLIVVTIFATKSMFPRPERRKVRTARMAVEAPAAGRHFGLQNARVMGYEATLGHPLLFSALVPALHSLRHMLASVVEAPGRALTGPRLRVRWPRRVRQIIWYLYLAVLSFLALLPVFWVISTSFKSQPEWFARPPVWISPTPVLENYVGLFVPIRVDIPGAIGATTALKPIANSLLVAGGATVVAAFVGFLTAYSISRHRTGGQGLPFFTLTTRMLPPIAVLIPLLAYLRFLRLFDTQGGLILFNAAISVAFFIWMMKTFIDDLPREIEEAAMLEGMSNWGVLFKIVLPLVKGGFLASALFVFIFIWSDFVGALTLTSIEAVTLPVQLFRYQTSGGVHFGLMSAISTVAIIPVFAFAYLIQKHLVRGLTFGAVRGK